MSISRHIVVAEDEPFCRSTLVLALNIAGYRVTEARDGQEALQAVQSAVAAGDAVDLLLTDINMPRLSGSQLVATLKDSNSQVPCVGITGHSDDETVEKVLRSGCVACLCKPFRIEDLIAKVSEVFDALELPEKQTKTSAEKCAQ